jgi:dGTPase
MPQTRAELEQLERQFLAPCAQFSGESRGRRFRETPPLWRTHFQRDRDRVIHSRAFRRLEYKTQVFLNGAGDHLRTRLTHTMEVAAIARNLASALRLNQDLAETIALAHDLGHAPFGHSGEDGLNRLMRKHGGFEHNHQSLRIVEELEQKYPRFSGLNLTWEVREGLAKHSTAWDQPGGRGDFTSPSPSLEAQVANLADETAYSSHDLDDGLETGLLEEKKLFRDVRVWRRATEAVEKEYGRLPDESRRSFIVRCIIDLQVRDLVLNSEKLIADAAVASADAVRAQRRPLVRHSPEWRKLNSELRSYLRRNLYFNPEVRVPNMRGVRMLEQLFRYYLLHPARMSERSRKRVRKDGLHRAVCDYLAGMTDRYAFLEHQRIFAPAPAPAVGRASQPPDRPARLRERNL